jgi:hypothetical protein
MKEIQKNSREVIRIGESEYEGHKFVDCRIYYDDNGEAIIETMEESNWKEFETN